MKKFSVKITNEKALNPLHFCFMSFLMLIVKPWEGDFIPMVVFTVGAVFIAWLCAICTVLIRTNVYGGLVKGRIPNPLNTIDHYMKSTCIFMKDEGIIKPDAYCIQVVATVIKESHPEIPMVDAMALSYLVWSGVSKNKGFKDDAKPILMEHYQLIKGYEKLWWDKHKRSTFSIG